MLQDKICYFNNNQYKLEIKNGKVFINKILLKQLGKGIDGEVYRFNNKAIKLYHDNFFLKPHLSKDEIIKLSLLHTKHIMLPKELLENETSENLGFVMPVVNLETKQNILLANKENLIKEIQEIEKELILLGKNHFLLDDNKEENLFYNGNFYMFDPDSFLYEEDEDFSKQNLEIFTWIFVKYIVILSNNQFKEQEIINNASNIYDLYRDGNYISLSYFLEDVINNNLEDVINKKNKTL